MMTMMMKVFLGWSVVVGFVSSQYTAMGQQLLRATETSAAAAAGVPHRELTGPIFRFALINADTEREIMNLSNGSVIALSTLSTKNLNLQAFPVRNVDSIQFDYDGHVNFFNEWHAPYGLCHNLNGRFEPCPHHVFRKGQHTLTATGKRDGRTVGSMTITFTVVNSPIRSH